MFEVGDYVCHVRQGPGRVTQVLPDQILVKHRTGTVFRVNSGIAEHELQRFPADGFIAFLFQSDPGAAKLQANIDDVLRRIARDKGRRAVPIKAVKAELLPILEREGKKWASWWKAARRRLQSSRGIVVDPKKKLVEIADVVGPLLSVAAVEQASTPQELLRYARQLRDAREPQQARSLANALAYKILRFPESSTAERRGTELLLACCYSSDHLPSEQIPPIRSWLERSEMATAPVFRDLDEDLTLCFPRLGRLAPAKATELAVACLRHPSPTVVQKAFSVLNTDRNRHLLKGPLLKWSDDPGEATLPNLYLYLQDDFLRHVRKEDLLRLYRATLRIESPDASVREFLNRPELADLITSALRTDHSLAASIVTSAAPSLEVKSRVAGSVDSAGHLVQQLIAEDEPHLVSALLACIPNLTVTDLLSTWDLLLRVIRTRNAGDLLRAAAARIADVLPTSSSIQQTQLLAAASQLHQLAKEYDLGLPALERAVDAAVGFLASHECPGDLSLLATAIRRQIDRALVDLRAELEAAIGREATLSAELAKKEEQLGRVSRVADMLKSSGSAERDEAGAVAKREALMPFLLLIDDLERRKGGGEGTAISAVLADVESALASAGVRRIGKPGDVIPFDPAGHELTSPAPDPVKEGIVVRSGYGLQTPGGTLVLRRALVRPTSQDPAYGSSRD